VKVETPADGDNLERYITLHGVKYVRKSEPPYTLFYVHDCVAAPSLRGCSNDDQQLLVDALKDTGLGCG
jgi:hypothetical protein